MGWLFSSNWSTREELREHLVNGNGVKTLKSCWVGNNMWAVQEYQRDGMTHPVRFVCLYLVQGKKGIEYGYKDVDETMGPYQMSCPVAYIELVEAHEKEHGYEPTGYAAEWRKSVRASRAKAKRKLVDGSKIKLYGREYTVEGQYPNKKYRVVDENGHCYALKKSQMKDVEVLA